MSQPRNKKIYKQGDRINIYLSRDIPPEFFDWINKQTDLSNFFLYAAAQLYNQTGFVNVAEVMPRKINFNLLDDATNEVEPKSPIIQEDTNPQTHTETEDESIEVIDESEEEKPAWADLDLEENDPFA